MNLCQQILFLLSALGAFNGLVLGLFILCKNGRSLQFLLLGIMLLMVSLRVAKSILVFFNPALPKPYLQLGLSACFLIGPAVYYFFRTTLGKIAVMPSNWKYEWAALLSMLLVGALFPYHKFPDAWCQIVVPFIYLTWGVYIVATGILLWPTIRSFFTNPSGLSANEQFWLWVYGGNSILYAFYLMALLYLACGIYISGGIAFTSFLYLSILFFARHAKLEQLLAVKTERKKIADHDAQNWSEKLGQLILERSLYKDPNLKLNDLARAINIPAHQLSQLLNDNMGKSFSTYINEYRIQEACKLIVTSEHLSFEAIGYEVGYNSKSTFYAAFRKVMDTTPALFKATTIRLSN